MGSVIAQDERCDGRAGGPGPEAGRTSSPPTVTRRDQMLTQDEKTTITSAYRAHEKDTGSAEVQVAMLTTRISQLTDHLRANKHDYSCRRSLMKLVGRRRRLLAYLNKTDVGRYRSLIASLGLRR